MSLKSLALCLVALVLMAPSALAAEKSFINGIDANYPPHTFLDDKGVPTGFDVEAMDWIANKMGFKVSHQPMEWDGIIPSLLAKKIDMICSGMSISEERKAKVTFSEPYWSTRKYILVRDDSPLTMDEVLKGGKVLGVQSGTNEAEFLKSQVENGAWNFTLKLYDSPPLAIEDLVNGRIDGGAIDSAPADLAMRKGGKPVKVIGEYTDSDDFGVAMRNEDAELHKMINEGFKLLKADPFWQELQDKYIHAK